MEVISYSIALENEFRGAGNAHALSYGRIINLPVDAIIDDVDVNEDGLGFTIFYRAGRSADLSARKIVLCQVREYGKGMSETFEVTAENRFIGRLKGLKQVGFVGTTYLVYEGLRLRKERGL